MNSTTRRIVMVGMIAAVYSAVTIGLAPLSFSIVQVRFAEILNLMAFIDPVYGLGVILGCFISNLLASPYGIIDIIIGTTSTAGAIYMITKTKSLFVASLWPTVFSIFVGLEISLLEGLTPGMPYVLTILSVMAGQFIALTCVGYPVFRQIVCNGSLRARFLNR